MKRIFNCGALASAVTGLCLLIGQAAAQQLPAVSGINGKIEFDAGILSVPSPSFVGRAAGTLTVPVGDRFGLQLDISGATAPGFTASGALHAFTRDPASYLIGGTLGVIRTPGATVVAAGPEAELYFDRWTLEAWGGVSYARPTVGPTRLAPFAMADLAYYLSDNARVAIGASTFDGYGSLQLTGEYLFDQWPVSVVGETRIGEDGAWRATLGLRAYLSPTPKTLIRRHREDDPTDRGAALYTAAGGTTFAGAPVPIPVQPAAASSSEPEVTPPTSSEPPPPSPPPSSSEEPPPGTPSSSEPPPSSGSSEVSSSEVPIRPCQYLPPTDPNAC